MMSSSLKWQRTNVDLPSLQDDFVDGKGELVTVRMDKSLEYLAIDYFGKDKIKEIDNDLFISFQTEHFEWVISTFACLGNKAEIIEPTTYRNAIRDFLEQAKKQYEI